MCGILTAVRTFIVFFLFRLHWLLAIPQCTQSWEWFQIVIWDACEACIRNVVFGTNSSFRSCNRALTTANTFLRLHLMFAWQQCNELGTDERNPYACRTRQFTNERNELRVKLYKINKKKEVKKKIDFNSISKHIENASICRSGVGAACQFPIKFASYLEKSRQSHLSATWFIQSNNDEMHWSAVARNCTTALCNRRAKSNHHIDEIQFYFARTKTPFIATIRLTQHRHISTQLRLLYFYVSMAKKKRNAAGPKCAKPAEEFYGCTQSEWFVRVRLVDQQGECEWDAHSILFPFNTSSK